MGNPLYVVDMNGPIAILTRVYLEFDQDGVYVFNNDLTLTRLEYDRLVDKSPLGAVIKYQKYIEYRRSEIYKEEAILNILEDQLQDLTLTSIDILNSEIDNAQVSSKA